MGTKIDTHHFCSLGAGNGEFQVGILLPVAEEEREFGKEAVVGLAEGSDGMRTGIPVDTTLERLNRPNEFLPRLVVVRLLFLQRVSVSYTRNLRKTYYLGPELSELDALLIVGPESVHLDAACRVDLSVV